MKRVKLLFTLSLSSRLTPRTIIENTSLNVVQERNINLLGSQEVVRDLSSVKTLTNYEEESLYMKSDTAFGNVNVEIKDTHNTALVHGLVHPIRSMTYTISMEGSPLNRGYKSHTHNQHGEVTGLFFLQLSIQRDDVFVKGPTNPTVLFVTSDCWGIAGVIDRLSHTLSKYSLGEKQILCNRS